MTRAIIFVDGENLTFRYQDMATNGSFTPEQYVVHEPNVFAWTPAVFSRMSVQPIRVNYYTAAVGDPSKLEGFANAIAKQRVPTNGIGLGYIELTPYVKPKDSQGRKTRVVDIAITKDLMRAALTTDIDAIVLMTGDGDFAQVVADVANNTSKQIFVAALSSGLSSELKRVGDGFQYLDAAFFSNAKLV